MQSPRALRQGTTALYRASNKHRPRASTAIVPCGGGAGTLPEDPGSGRLPDSSGLLGPGWGLGLLAQLGLGPQHRAAGLE